MHRAKKICWESGSPLPVLAQALLARERPGEQRGIPDLLAGTLARQQCLN